MDICIDAPQAHPSELNQRPHSTFRPHSPASHPHDCHCFTPDVVLTLLPRPESHSP
jgi:hypothetical protein